MEKIMLAISAGEWEGIQHRPHHFMRRSAKTGWTVIYLEPPATLIAPLKNKQMLNRWRNWLKGLRHVEDGVYLLAPPPTLPFGNKIRVINKINQWWIAKTIKRALKTKFSDGNQEPIQIDLYAFLPNAVDLLPYFNFRKVIYDCVDDHGAFTGLINADLVYQMEKELMGQADLSFATAKQLMEDRKDWSKHFYLIPNGAEYEHFAREGKAKGEGKGTDAGIVEIPEVLQQVPHPIVGFVGGISDWIDIPLVTRVAKQMPEVSFVFIGPVATNVDELKQLPNVTMLGAKPYQQLPEYIAHFDTCLIPFKINKLTESVNPIKLFEYLSAGKPVVSTPLPEVVAYQEVVEIAGNEEEMIEAIRRTIQPSEKEKQRIEKRQEVGKANSWDARWQQAVKYIEEGQAEENRTYVTS
ncbi:glycosyltransferase [Tepidibacillus infernus]|uniref:glycosyltransferase n=1 Tax=Tepidibacillus infernus TaxID=1806172 RepID=UPI003B6DF027